MIPEFNNALTRQLKEGRVYFGLQFESVVNHGREATAVGYEATDYTRSQSRSREC